MSAIRSASIALSLLAAAAMPALAQGEACRIDYGKPGQVKDALRAVETAIVGKP